MCQTDGVCFDDESLEGVLARRVEIEERGD
jgi:hypothetical protein